MQKCLRLSLMFLILLINIGSMGCTNSRNSAPPQGQNIVEKVPQTKKQDYQGGVSNKVIIDAPIISQNPELKSGCEVTSLAMLLQYAGINVDKMTLAEKIKKDTTPLDYDEDEDIEKWGDPNYGFVGDITGEDEGFAVYPIPMLELMEQYMPGRPVDLTKQSFEVLLNYIDQRHPVIVWVTIDFGLPKKYEEWEKNGTSIKATLDEHAVLLTGYDKDYCYINNPFNGMKNQEINKGVFINIWNIMGNMAISYK